MTSTIDGILESNRRFVAAIFNHPLVPKDVTVRGFIIGSVTGGLTEIK